jgi:hypothetical protein
MECSPYSFSVPFVAHLAGGVTTGFLCKPQNDLDWKISDSALHDLLESLGAKHASTSYWGKRNRLVKRRNRASQIKLMSQNPKNRGRRTFPYRKANWNISERAQMAA